MNMKSLTVILGGIAVFALGACTVTGTGSTTTGTGGGTTTATTTTTASVGGAGGGGGATSTATGTGGAPTCDNMYTCAEAITPPNGDPGKLCLDNASGKAFTALSDCTCTGACKADCSDNVCMAGGSASDKCTACLQSATGCKTEFDSCANN